MTEIVSNYFLKLKKKFSALKLEQSILATKPILSFCIILLTVLTLKSLQLTYSYFTNPENVWGASCYASKSALFDGSTGYLTRTPTVAGNRTVWANSVWLKRTTLGNYRFPFLNAGNANAGGTLTGVSIHSSNALRTFWNDSGSPNASVQVLRDPSDWYNIIQIANGTSLSVYINGVLWQTVPIIGNGAINNTEPHQIGASISFGTTYADFGQEYLANYIHTDGVVSALTPTAFGTLSTSSGKWVPKEYTGTYGTNGFHLNFANSLALGSDVSGNGNHWTVNGGVTASQDSPTTNYPVFNPLSKPTSITNSNGNLTINNPDDNQYHTAEASIAIPKTGKWYAEAKIGTQNATVAFNFGLLRSDQLNPSQRVTSGVLGITYFYPGETQYSSASGQIRKYNQAIDQTVSTATFNDVIGIAFDTDAGTVTYYKNGVQLGTPITNAYPANSTLSFSLMANGFGTANFGPNFSFSPPTGYSALSAANLPAPTITNPSLYFKVATYTGNGTTQTLNFNFTPALIWIKDRTSANAHGLWDYVRNAASAQYGYLSSNSTAALTYSATALTSFLSNGFTLGTNALFNTNGNNYISWNWKEDPTAGFDIVSYTGNGANRTIAHSLSATPTMMIIKRTDTAGSNWAVFHQSLTSSSTQHLFLNTTAVETTDATMWNSTAPTSAVFSLGTNANVNTNGGNYIAYLFTEKSGFSKFASYTGNSSTDGPFVYTGFKPRYIIIKDTNQVNGWNIFDTARSPSNEVNLYIPTTVANGDTTFPGIGLDINSTGFKIRGTQENVNQSGRTYIYAAFAESPFKEQSSAYNLSIATSTRFNGTNAYLTRTPAVAGNQTTWTWSGWVKRGTTGVYNTVFSAGTIAANIGSFYFENTDNLQIYTMNGTSLSLRTSQVFRDPSAWMHVVVQYDSTQVTASDRAKIWINGTQVTSFSTETYPALNAVSSFNASGMPHTIGVVSGPNGGYHSGYLSNVYFLDGVSTTSAAFGEYDTNGLWKPKSYLGTYGTNGFHLPLMGTSTASSIGTDTSGNNNFFTNNNIATTDFVADTPTNNFAVLNPLDANTTFLARRPSLSEGNLSATGGTGGYYDGVKTTHGAESGKWYWEVGISGTDTANGNFIGITDQVLSSAWNSDFNLSRSVGWNIRAGGLLYVNQSSSAYSFTGATGDTLMVALDLDNGKIWFGKNGSWNQGGNPSLGSTPDSSSFQIPGVHYSPINAFRDYNSISNFGQGGQSGLTYDAAAGGYFKYTPPTGFKALSTSNMPASAITKPNNYFDAVTYTGTGAIQSITSLNFTPALVWLKDRTSANAHRLFSSVFPSGLPYLSSNSAAAEVNSSTGVTSMSSSAVSIGSNALFNTNGNNYVAWAFASGTTPGFDVVSWSGNSTGRLISHSLNATPSLMILFSNSVGGRSHVVWHKSFNSSSNSDYMYLDLTGSKGQYGAASFWNNTSPTNLNFSVGTDLTTNTTGSNYIAYLWSEVDGFSKFGSFTGNGSADGPFVYTGFKPAFIIVKSSSLASAWELIDTSRNTYNPVDKVVQAQDASAEITVSGVDLLSNGFKIRTTNSDFNNNSNTYIYAAFAESPFAISSTDTSYIGTGSCGSGSSATQLPWWMEF